MQNLPTPAALTTLSTPSGPTLGYRDQPTSPMKLTSRAKSATATLAINALAAQIIVLQGNRKIASKQYHAALGAIVADLIRAASYDPVRLCYRPLEAASFTGSPIGYQPFVRALNDLECNGFVQVVRGLSACGDRLGTVTRIHVTPRLTDFLAGMGVTVADRWKHFDYGRAADDVDPIQLRAKSIRRGRSCGSAWKRDPVSGVIGVEKGPLILVF